MPEKTTPSASRIYRCGVCGRAVRVCTEPGVPCPRCDQLAWRAERPAPRARPLTDFERRAAV